MKLLSMVFAAMLVLSNSTTFGDEPTGIQSMANGLQYEDDVIGTGRAAQKGDMAEVHYTGWLQKPDGSKGAKFDSSKDHNQTFSFKIGGGQVIQGWEEGLIGMKVGGKRTLVIPPHLGYGARGAGYRIPPNSTLIFDIELVNLK